MRVAHSKVSSEGLIDGSDWDADHIIEDPPAQGEPGTPGQDGADGAPGTDGASAYDIAVTNGFVGTEVEWLASLKGEKGDTGDTGLQGDPGIPGADGQDGAPGADGEGVPAGVIAMWGGNVNQIPSGWLLCDGTNGTPDLTDRFIKAGTPGNTGGSATHTHAAHSEVISHSHSVAVTDPGHAHVENSNNATTGPNRGWGAADTSTNTSTATGYSTASATTGITASASDPAGAVAELAHDSVSNEPAFYTLAFIQKS